MFLVGSVALFCGIAAISIAREYAKESAATRQQNAVIAAAATGATTTTTTVRPVRLRAAEPSGSGDVDDYVPLNGDISDNDDDGESGGLLGVGRAGAGARASDGPRREEGAAAAAAATSTSTRTPLVPKGKRDYGMGRVSRSGGARRRGRAAPAEPAPLGPSRLARKVYFYTRLVCGTIMAGALITCGAVVAFAPHAPGVNVCNTEFDWVSERRGGGRRRRWRFV